MQLSRHRSRLQILHRPYLMTTPMDTSTVPLTIASSQATAGWGLSDYINANYVPNVLQRLPSTTSMVNEPTNNDGKEEEDTTKSQLQWTATNISSCEIIRENCLNKLQLLRSKEKSLQNGIIESQKSIDLEL